MNEQRRRRKKIQRQKEEIGKDQTIAWFSSGPDRFRQIISWREKLGKKKQLGPLAGCLSNKRFSTTQVLFNFSILGFQLQSSNLQSSGHLEKVTCGKNSSPTTKERVIKRKKGESLVVCWTNLKWKANTLLSFFGIFIFILFFSFTYLNRSSGLFTVKEKKTLSVWSWKMI